MVLTAPTNQRRRPVRFGYDNAAGVLFSPPALLLLIGFVVVPFIMAFVLSMQTFLNIAVWVWLAEIFPLQIRGLAIGIAVFFGWFINGLLALYVPTLLAALGMGTFFLFAVIGVIMLGFLWHEVPETRGRSLESLEEDLMDGSIYRSLPRRLPFAGVLYDRGGSR